MTPIKSSAFSHMDIDPQARTVTVRFHSGDVWRYRDVQLERLTALEGAASKGAYFMREIRPNHIGSQVFDQ